MTGGSALEPLFQPGMIGSLLLPNRLVVAPMTRISATPDGLATDEMTKHYARFAAGGFGLIVTEGCYPDTAHSQTYVDQPGLATDRQALSWKPVIQAVHANGGHLVAQIMHGGALSQYNSWKSGSVAPSAVMPLGEMAARYKGHGRFAIPRALDPDEIHEIVHGFATAAARAAEVGFDGVELHGANGYIIDQFLTDYTNRRADDWGGSLPNRLRFAIETVKAVKAAVPAGFPVGIRISQSKINDLTHEWAGGIADARTIFSTVGSLEVDWIHVAAHLGTDPVFGGRRSLAGLAKESAGRACIIANGKLETGTRGAELIKEGEADFVSLAKGALADPQWPVKTLRGEKPIAFDPGMISPDATLATTEAFRVAG